VAVERVVRSVARDPSEGITSVNVVRKSRSMPGEVASYGTHRRPSRFADSPEGRVGAADSPVSAVLEYLRRLTWGRIGELLVGIALGLVVAEVAVRWLNPQEEIMPRGVMVADPVLDVAMRPNYRGAMSKKAIPLITNSWGFRDREYQPPSNGSLRLYVLGDSMVFGYGVPIERTFPRMLEGMLQQRLGRTVEVVNGGVPGYGTLQELQLFEHTVATIKPQVVVVAVAVLNDIADNIKFSARGRGGRGGVAQLLIRARAWLRQRSQLYLLIHRRLTAPTGADIMQIHAVTPAAQTQRGLRLTAAALAQFATTAQSQHAAFAVVIIPAHKQVSPALWAESLQRYRLSSDAYDPDEPDENLANAVRRDGVALLDLRPTLRAHWQEPIYWDGDGEHWEVQGHALVAEAIGEFLLNGRLIPPAAPPVESEKWAASGAN